jgi:hypothetical protein
MVFFCASELLGSSKLGSLAFHDAGDLEMIRPLVISGMQGWYLAWLQDRFLSSVACKDEVSGDGEAVGLSFFCL